MLLACRDRLPVNPARHHYGVAVSDIDGDGRFELVVTGYGCPNLALQWDGRQLVDRADATLADAEALAVSVCAADLDGDGREELYLLNADKSSDRRRHPDRLLAPFGPHWLDLLAQPEHRGLLGVTPGRSVACLDRLGAGRYGFVIAAFGGPLQLLEMGRRGHLFDLAEEAGLDLSAHARALVAGPLISERMDLYLASERGPNFLFRNQGDGTFEEVAAAWGVADPFQDGRGCAVLDADGDGLMDLVCANWAGPHRLFLQRPGGGFTDAAPEDLANPSKTRTVVVADFDNDGYEEIFFNNFGQPNRLLAWRRDRWLEIDGGDAVLGSGYGTGGAVADIDGDGRLELLLSHGEGAAQPLALFRPLPNDNGWLRVMPLTPAGAPARGALVTCSAEGRSQRRVICAGSGYLCQMEPVAHFGLGSAAAVERVTVRWPDGALVEIAGPPVGRLLTVPHPPSP